MVTSAEVAPEEYANLQQELISLRSRLDEKNAELASMLADMNSMKSVTRNLLLDTDQSKSSSSRDQHGSIKSVSENRTEKEDSGYAGSYAHFGIHHEMLSDKIRTQSYKDAVCKNSSSLKDKFILDLGCGTGILCMFAADTGAKQIFGVECADIAEAAIQIVKENGFEDRIKIIKGKVEEIELPIRRVDIIISEWMGYFLLYESMVDTVLYARDKWLANDGILLSDQARIHLCAIEDEQFRRSKLEFWDDVYGYKMSFIKNSALTEPLVDVVSANQIISSSDCILELDLYTITVFDLDFETQFSLHFFSKRFLSCSHWFL